MYKLAASAFVSLVIGIGIGWFGAFESPATAEAKASEALAARFERLERSIGWLEKSLTERPPIVVGTEAGNVPAFDETRLERAIERLLQSELREALAKRSPEKSGDSFDNEAASSPQREEAYELAHETVLSALARRRWTDEDRETLQEAMRHLSAAQRQEVAGGLVRAINEGQIEIEGMLAF